MIVDATLRLKRQGFFIRLLFFLAYAAGAAWLTYFYVFLKQARGLTGYEVGLLAGIQQFNNVLVLPMWGLWADKFGRKRMMAISLGATTLMVPCFLWLHGPWAIILFMVCVTLVYNPLVSLADTIALDFEEQTQGRTSFGEIRLWASVGWGLAAFLTGLYIGEHNMHLIFHISSGLFVLTFLVLLLGYKPIKQHACIKRLPKGAVLNLLRSELLLGAFLLLVFLYSIFSSPLYLLLNVYLDEIGASSSYIGLAYMVGCLSELPFFFYGKRIVERFGAKSSFLGVMGITALRMLFYGLNGSPLVAVAIGMMHGVTIGLFFVSVIAYVHKLVPPQLRSTGQSLIYTFYPVGVALGNLLTGSLSDVLGMRQSMMLLGVGILLLLAVTLLAGKQVSDRLQRRQQCT